MRTFVALFSLVFTLYSNRVMPFTPAYAYINVVVWAFNIILTFRYRWKKAHKKLPGFRKRSKYIKLIRCHWCYDCYSCSRYCCFFFSIKTKTQEQNRHALAMATLPILYDIDQDKLKQGKKMNMESSVWSVFTGVIFPFSARNSFDAFIANIRCYQQIHCVYVHSLWNS